ncbi:hypothetical protein F3J23_11980 [Chryseobacterium sp. Tr-659]|uniref:NAD-dependent epimerase/dehydratase family protein n=1 Tax=Chryseobacterium sp. Tr-659 TaxID=2608340 RepID=UPI0014237648|nr:NAD-dependent epimerase/dehydratase family protein [Chryseobacterium sp. Tr-659]NIF06160.1 hypothetical protein [Chryseobacterium sp. Tr-659]
MKKTVLITGGNSFIAKHLKPMLLQNYNVKLLSRNPQNSNEYIWDLDDWSMDEAALDDVEYIVHLAGSKLNDGTPLTKERMKLIYDTRIGAADFLREKLKARNQKLIGFVSASAIGYYGFTDSTLEIDENGAKGIGFSADLCEDWEKSADRFKAEQVASHVSKIRVSLALGNNGGIFPMYKEMIKTNPKAAAQDNTDSFAWNHVEDMAGIFDFAVTHNLDGVYNSVAPVPASLQDVFKAISNNTAGTNYNITPYEGKHLVAHKIINAGYQFKYPTIEMTVNNLIVTA